jgi:hypothetical protein
MSDNNNPEPKKWPVTVVIAGEPVAQINNNSGDVPLEAMLRRASRMAEQMFDKDGEVTSFWLAETAVGQQQTIVTPMVFPPGVPADEAKRMLAKKMREHFKEHNVVRYAHAAEAWKGHDSWPGRPSEDPQRQELVVISADDGCECLIASRDIVRPQGGKPYLTKLSDIEREKQPRGRLMDLLNDDIRPSSELPDDEGTVFVTDVPRAPFQVYGRRGPTGELFVGDPFHAGASSMGELAQEYKAQTGCEIEVVTGPEAERLIRGMQRRIVQH